MTRRRVGPAPARTRLVHGIVPETESPARVKRRFQGLLAAGVRLNCVGAARHEGRTLPELGYVPRYAVRLFDVTYYLTRLYEDPNFRFFVAYVHLHPDARDLHARIFYKDSSLVWRSPSHCILTETENWIGKGAIKRVVKGGVSGWFSAEETTNLPLEIQGALDDLSRRSRRVPQDLQAVRRVLRNAPVDRVAPYEDFAAPRRRAMARKRDRINGGEDVAWFEREGDPRSLRFAPGYEPDFRKGVIEMTTLGSRMYAGEVRKYRILSRNAEIQYQFIAAPRLVWIIPPQALTTEIMSYGLRTVDVEGDEDAFMPGYEYHFFDEAEDPPAFYSQIPEGYAGEQSTVDPSRADAGPWLERLPVIRAFRRAIPLPWPAPERPRKRPHPKHLA